MEKRYGLICEHKMEGPLIWESQPMTYFEASARARKVQDNPNIIRVAVFAMQYATGNETLIPKESEF